MREYIVKAIPESPVFSELSRLLDSPSLASVYWAKGIHNLEDLKDFSSFSNLLPVDELFDVSSFYERILFHREKKSKVVIYGDYDADGAVAAAILWRFLSKVLGMNATVYIPDRHEEGYGLNKLALEALAKQGTDLVITVDCGVRDGELISEIMKSSKLEIMITDHHQPGDTFPQCVTVHPLFPQHESKNRFTSGGVVAWKVCRYLEHRFGLSHEFTDSVVDLAGTSLVTDIMPLVGENRVILRNGLRKLHNNPSLGLKAIIESAQIQANEISTYHLGYIIGPRLNASGRIGNQYTSTRLLSTDKDDVARKLAQEVADVNSKRQEITKEIYTKADQSKKIIAEKIIVTAGVGWDDGIVGLVAGKLMNRYDLPTIAVTIDAEKGLAKGSARSFGELNITALFEKISEVFARFGGHHNAAGFTLSASNDAELVTKVTELLIGEYAEYQPTLRKTVDAIVSPQELTEEFFEHLKALEPFGLENQEPLFAVEGKVEQFSTFGQQGNHLRLTVRTETGMIKALIFDRPEMLSRIEQGEFVVLIGRPKQDEYQGRKQLSFFVEHIQKERLQVVTE